MKEEYQQNGQVIVKSPKETFLGGVLSTHSIRGGILFSEVRLKPVAAMGAAVR